MRKNGAYDHREKDYLKALLKDMDAQLWFGIVYVQDWLTTQE
jgi:hypothetical protein